MARKDTPSAVMYAKLKAFGISNREAANLLMNTALTFDGKMLRDRIEESSQLSRRIVHTRPGEIPIALFNSFPISCPQLERRIVDTLAMSRCRGNRDRAQEVLASALADECATDMMAALRACNVDESPYRNMASYIAHADLPDEDGRTLLALMMFVITGCLGNPRSASIMVVDYATNILGADFHTAQTVITVAANPELAEPDVVLGLVRVMEGRIQAGSMMHVLDPGGTELGLLPAARHAISDVDDDVSRSHALIWREDGAWRIRDLGSTNGTRVVSGADGIERTVEPGRESSGLEIAATDIICLGATTRFIVMPVMGS